MVSILSHALASGNVLLLLAGFLLFTNADPSFDGGEDSCRDHGDGSCREERDAQNHDRTMGRIKHSRACESFPSSSYSASMKDSYGRGTSAQAYKPDAPIKRRVCEVGPSSDDDVARAPHRVARNMFWRSNHDDAVPVVVRGSIYACGSPPSSSSRRYDVMGSGSFAEVWQPRPDGRYSSLRPGVEEGECRARVPIFPHRTEGEGDEGESFSNYLGRMEYETLAPGSAGVLGGLVPESWRDYPPYGPGAIHMYLDLEGYLPALVQLNANELESSMSPQNAIGGRFRFSGWDVRPHASAKNNADFSSGMEVRSVKRISRPGYDSALEVEVDVFLVPYDDGPNEGAGNVADKRSRSDVFCSPWGFSDWASSFFKEPIAVCFPSLLDFFAL